MLGMLFYRLTAWRKVPAPMNLQARIQDRTTVVVGKGDVDKNNKKNGESIQLHIHARSSMPKVSKKRWVLRRYLKSHVLFMRNNSMH